MKQKTATTEQLPNSPHHVTINNLSYKDAVLRIAYTQWQFGDWASLAMIDDATLLHHPDCAVLALLSAAAHLQLGASPAARACLKLARSAGCPTRLIGEVLVAGMYNSLGRIAAINGNNVEALECFRTAIELHPQLGDTRLICWARAREQLAQLGFPLIAENATLASQVCLPSTTIKVEQLSFFNLGLAWSSNTVNTVVFRHHGVLTWKGFQYTAFYLNESNLRVVQRKLTNNDITTYDIEGHYNLRDAHNSISLGVDGDGYIHITYDHHATKLRYRRSSQPFFIGGWTNELPMTGANEDRVTYPTFILPRFGYPLTMLYRDGYPNRGSARMKTYSEFTQSWSDRPLPILSGAEQKPWTSNAYWNHPAVGSDGSLHLSFVWRTDSLGERELVNNINISYAWSPDNGVTWFSSLGQPYKLPITQVNAEVIWPISPGSNLINQTSMALDSRNRPHIVFYANDLNGIPQYQHIWFDGLAWHQEFFSARTQSFILKGGGTLQIPICRPEVLIDRHDNVYAIYRGDITQDRMSVVRLGPSKISTEATQNSDKFSMTSVELWPEALGYAEPIVDRSRWAEDEVLTMLIQHNQQPNGDLMHQVHSAPINLVDFRFHN